MTKDELTSKEYELLFDIHLVGEKTRLQGHLGAMKVEKGDCNSQKTDTFLQNYLIGLLFIRSPQIF